MASGRRYRKRTKIKRKCKTGGRWFSFPSFSWTRTKKDDKTPQNNSTQRRPGFTKAIRLGSDNSDPSKQPIQSGTNNQGSFVRNMQQPFRWPATTEVNNGLGENNGAFTQDMMRRH